MSRHRRAENCYGGRRSSFPAGFGRRVGHQLGLAGFLLAMGSGLAAESVDLLETARVTLATDRAEKASSETTADLEAGSGMVSVRYRVPEHHALRYAYVALNLTLPEAVGQGMPTLEFDARIDPGSAQPFAFAVRTGAGRTYRRDFKGYPALTPDWQTYRIPLSDLSVPEYDRSGVSFIQITVASHSLRDDIDLQEGRIQLRNLRLSTAPAEGILQLPDYRAQLAGRPRFSRARGHAAWVYSIEPRFLDEIRAFNATSPVRIDMLFVGTTYLSVEDGKPKVSAFSPDLAWYIEHAPPGVEVHAMVASGQGRPLAACTPEAQAELARELATLAHAVPGLAGMHFDVEPYVVDALPFYIAFKEAYDKPVSAALDRWDGHVLWVIDYAVVMAYGKARTPERYASGAERMIRDFGADAARAGRSYFPGIAMAQTNLEYEVEINAKTGERTESGAQMEDFTRAVLRRLGDLPADPHLGGLAFWAFMPEQTRIFADFPKFPRHIKPECFDAVREFSEALITAEP